MMKKHLSLFALYIRASFLPFLLLLLLSGTICSLLFFNKLTWVMEQAAEGGPIYGLETLFGDTVIPWVVAVALVLLILLLCIQGSAFGSQTAYTMSRLRISEKAAFVWQVLYNVLAFFVFWAFHGALLWGLCSWYVYAAPNATAQTVLLALYRQDFIHGLLPLQDISLLIRNIAFCVGLGAFCAHFTYKQRSGKASYGIIPLLIYVIGSFAFSEGMGNAGKDIVGILIGFVFGGAMIVAVLTDNMRFLFEDEEETRLENCSGISYKKEEP